MRVLLKDGSVLEQGKWKQTDVAIENGVIVARGGTTFLSGRESV